MMIVARHSGVLAKMRIVAGSGVRRGGFITHPVTAVAGMDPQC